MFNVLNISNHIILPLRNLFTNVVISVTADRSEEQLNQYQYNRVVFFPQSHDPPMKH